MREAQKTFWRRHWKGVLNAFTALAFIGAIIAVRGNVGDAFSNLARVHTSVLFLLIPLEFWNYDAQARAYRDLFRLVGNDVSYFDMLKASLELNFINNVFPSGGLSGVSYFGLRMRGTKISGSKAALVQVFKLLMIYLAFEALLIIGVFIMAAGGQVNRFVIFVATAISTLLVVGTGLFVFIIGSRSRINTAFSAVSAAVNWLTSRFGFSKRSISADKLRNIVDELHDNYKLIKTNYRQLLKGPFVQSLLVNLTEVAALYVVFIAFGHRVNIGAVILGYAVANLSGLVSVFPGGIGLYEFLMTGVLLIAGVPLSLSIPVTVMYRVLTAVLQVPFGYYFYNRSLYKGQFESNRP